MRNALKHLSYALLLAFLVAGISATPVFAQEYKETYNAALEAARAKKYSDAYQLFSKAADQATKAGDKDVAARAHKVAAQIDYNLGVQLNQSEKFADALKRFENGIKHYPTYAKNYMGKAVALKGLEREEEAIATYKQLMDVGKKEGDTEAVNAAQTAIRDHYVFLASSALGRSAQPSAGDAREALEHLAQLETYPDIEADADVIFYQAVAQNVLGNYEEAIALADQALEMHRGSKTDKAKIYFIKGEALMYKGDVAAAKDAFRNATFGSYKAPAEHYIETL